MRQLGQQHKILVREKRRSCNKIIVVLQRSLPPQRSEINHVKLLGHQKKGLYISVCVCLCVLPLSKSRAPVLWLSGEGCM